MHHHTAHIPAFAPINEGVRAKVNHLSLSLARIVGIEESADYAHFAGPRVQTNPAPVVIATMAFDHHLTTTQSLHFRALPLSKTAFDAFALVPEEKFTVTLKLLRDALFVRVTARVKYWRSNRNAKAQVVYARLWLVPDKTVIFIFPGPSAVPESR